MRRGDRRLRPRHRPGPVRGLDRRQPAQGAQRRARHRAQPTDRGKLGWKWSLATDRNGIPIGWAIDGANRHDVRLFEPTLDAVERRAGLLAEIETLHLDRGYDAGTVRALCARRGLHDAVIAKKRKRGQAAPDRPADTSWRRVRLDATRSTSEAT
ncbi:MAG: transposase [Egibacteraceae bacterium]